MNRRKPISEVMGKKIKIEKFLDLKMKGAQVSIRPVRVLHIQVRFNGYGLYWKGDLTSQPQKLINQISKAIEKNHVTSMAGTQTRYLPLKINKIGAFAVLNGKKVYLVKR